MTISFDLLSSANKNKTFHLFCVIFLSTFKKNKQKSGSILSTNEKKMFVSQKKKQNPRAFYKSKIGKQCVEN